MAVVDGTWWQIILQALWLMLPAYLANMAPVFVGGGAPIDGGRIWKDGNPILGPGKTWRGLLLAPLVAAVLVIVLDWIARAGYLDGVGVVSFGGPAIAFVFGYILGLGALVGDAVKSFFKRRRDRERGAPWPPFDQLDFVVGTLVFGHVFALLMWPVLGENWMLVRWGGWHYAVVFLLTPGLHFLVNVLGYMIGKKEVPW